MLPAAVGLSALRPGFRRRVIAIYAAIAILAIALPALLAQPRSAWTHRNQQAARTIDHHDGSLAPGR
jgi:hypothetical protein